MQYSSSISSSNRRFLAALAVGLLALVAVDHWLYARRGFLDLFGPATQEGQILAKLDKAPRFAAAADIIMFGSSFTRSGISTQPFLDKGILPFNFGISAGGPLFAYYALAHIRPVLEAREKKPVLVLEINEPAGETNLNQFEHIFATVRTRSALIRDFPDLLQHAREHDKTSQFLAGVFLPSLRYRAYGRYVLGGGRFHDGSLAGNEDAGGYAAINSIRPDELPAVEEASGPAPYPASTMTYIERFLRIAAELDAPVVLYRFPNVKHWSSRRTAELVAHFRAAFPTLNIVSLGKEDIALTRDDIQSCCGMHLNANGSDKVAAALIDKLGLRGDRENLARRWRALVDETRIPAPALWTGGSPDTRVAGADGGLTIDFNGTGKNDDVLMSPAFTVYPGMAAGWLNLDMAFDLSAGHIWVAIDDVEDSGDVRNASHVRLPQGDPAIEDRQIMRHGGMTLVRIARTEQVRLRITQIGDGVEGRLTLRRLWSEPRPESPVRR